MPGDPNRITFSIKILFHAERLEQIYYPKAINQQKKQLIHDTNQTLAMTALLLL